MWTRSVWCVCVCARKKSEKSPQSVSLCWWERFISLKSLLSFYFWDSCQICFTCFSKDSSALIGVLNLDPTNGDFSVLWQSIYSLVLPMWSSTNVFFNQRRICEPLTSPSWSTAQPCQWGCFISISHTGLCCCLPLCGASATPVYSPPGRPPSVAASPRISWTLTWGTGGTIQTFLRGSSRGWGWRKSMEITEELESRHPAWLRSWISSQTLQARQKKNWSADLCTSCLFIYLQNLHPPSPLQVKSDCGWLQPHHTMTTTFVWWRNSWKTWSRYCPHLFSLS